MDDGAAADAPRLGCQGLRITGYKALELLGIRAMEDGGAGASPRLALGPLVHHILLPLRTYAPPPETGSARADMLHTSEPAPGSLMARAPMCSPASVP